MLHDLMTTSMTRILVSDMDSGSDKINSGFSILPLTETLYWEISAIPEGEERTISESIVISFVTPVNIKEVQWNVTANTIGKTKLLYSYDSIDCIEENKVDYTEYEYFSYTIEDLTGVDDDIRNLLMVYEGNIIEAKSFYKYFPSSQYTLVGNTYLFRDEDGNIITTEDKDSLIFFETVSGMMLLYRVYIIYEKNSKKIVDISSDNLELLKRYLEEVINSGVTDVVVPRYQFSYYDKYLESTVYLFDKRISSIKLDFTNFVITEDVSFTLNSLHIYAESYISDLAIEVDELSDNYFQPKYFYDYPFIPSIAKTFLEMLTHKV